jgi:hypothetical protein
MSTYAFADTMAAIAGPSGAFDFGFGSGNAEGGITVEMVEDKNTMVIGADGFVQHNLHSGQGGTITVRLLKTSPTNAQFSKMYAVDTSTAMTHGRNTITIQDLARGDKITAQFCAFSRLPSITYAKEGGEQAWAFHCGRIDMLLGPGVNAVTGAIGVGVPVTITTGGAG